MIPKRGNRYIDVGSGMNRGTVVIVVDNFNRNSDIRFKVLKLGYNEILTLKRTYELGRDRFNKQFKLLNRKIRRIE